MNAKARTVAAARRVGNGAAVAHAGRSQWFGARASSEMKAGDPIAHMPAVIGCGGLLDARPKKNVVGPEFAALPTHSGFANVKLMMSPSCSADLMPMLPSPPCVTT